MKKLLIFISLIFISSNIYCQNLKGSLKYGGEYQNGESFKIIYQRASSGKVDRESYIADKENFGDYIVFFNYNNENEIQIFFPDGRHNIIYNINNIEKHDYGQEAEGGDQDSPPYNNMTITLDTLNERLIIIHNKSKKMQMLAMPK